jgi:GNAT superfamily N-acetyltransferase
VIKSGRIKLINNALEKISVSDSRLFCSNAGLDYLVRRAELSDKYMVNLVANKVFLGSDLLGFKIQFKNYLDNYSKKKSQLSWTRSEIIKKSALLSQDYYVIVSGNVIIGFSGIEVPNYDGDMDIGWLNWTAIDPKFQGIGLGTELLQYVLDQADAFRLKRFGIKTTPQLYPNAGKLYLKKGFTLSGKLKNYYGKGLDCDMYFKEE